MTTPATGPRLPKTDPSHLARSGAGVAAGGGAGAGAAEGAAVGTGRASVPASERYRLRASGRVADLGVDDVDRVVVSAMHLWPLSIVLLLPLALLVPVVLWLSFRGRSSFVDDHGREAMNAQLTLLALLLVPCLGWVLLVPWMLVWFVALVRGAVAGAAGEFFRYPMILRPIR